MLSKFLTSTNPKIFAETPLANEIRYTETFSAEPFMLEPSFRPEINKKSEEIVNKKERLPIHERQFEVIRKRE
jgi:hypothetical protein